MLANAAAETKRDKGVYASMKRAFSPYVENHSHAVLYGIIGFVAAALILIVGFWPTVLLAVFAAIGVVIGKYRDGDRKTRPADETGPRTFQLAKRLACRAHPPARFAQHEAFAPPDPSCYRKELP